MACLVFTQVFLLRWRWFEARNPWLQLAISGLSGAVIFAPAGVLIDTGIAGEPVQAASPWLEILDEFSGLAPPAIVVWVAINAPWILGFRLEQHEPPPVDVEPDPEVAESTAVPGAGPAFLELLPAEVRGEVISLQAELHYITVVTVHGRALILYNLKDAIEELEASGVAGVQCHRSFWVALAFASGIEKQGRQGALRLTNGDRIPVSRRKLDEVKARLEV
jgi:hypothetical protein